MMPPSVHQGQRAEQQAEGFLLRQGLALVGRNYRKRFGEIDLIVRDQDVLVFVEVRKRSHRAFGDGAESIDRHKRQRLLRTAEAYLQEQRWRGAVRFDVVVLDAQDRIEWLQDAIQATS
jgi:putative endonuclease